MDGRAPPTVSSFWPSLKISDCDIVSLLRIVKVTGDKIQVRAKIASGEIFAGAVNEIDFHTYSVERVVKRPQDTL
jgi:predicted RNA-binding protein